MELTDVGQDSDQWRVVEGQGTDQWRIVGRGRNQCVVGAGQGTDQWRVLADTIPNVRGP